MHAVGDELTATSMGDIGSQHLGWGVVLFGSPPCLFSHHSTELPNAERARDVMRAVVCGLLGDFSPRVIIRDAEVEMTEESSPNGSHNIDGKRGVMFTEAEAVEVIGRFGVVGDRLTHGLN